MADELIIQKSTLDAIGDAVRIQTEKTDSIPVPNLASEILSIPKGVTVQRTTGTLSTDSSGYASANCGFKPDLVVLYKSEYYDHSGISVYFVASIPFLEYIPSGTSAVLNVAMWTNSSYGVYDIFSVQTDTGFELYVDDYNGNAISSLSLNYIAVKYS